MDKEESLYSKINPQLLQGLSAATRSALMREKRFPLLSSPAETQGGEILSSELVPENTVYSTRETMDQRRHLPLWPGDTLTSILN